MKLAWRYSPVAFNKPTGHTVYSTQELFEDLLAHIYLPDILPLDGGMLCI